jgi:hypothetical protein
LAAASEEGNIDLGLPARRTSDADGGLDLAWLLAAAAAGGAIAAGVAVRVMRRRRGPRPIRLY